MLLAISLVVFIGYRLSRANLISFVSNQVILRLPVKIKISSSGSTPLGGMYFNGIKLLDDNKDVVAEIEKVSIDNTLSSLVTMFMDKEGTVCINVKGVRIDADRSQIEELIEKFAIDGEPSETDDNATESEMNLFFDAEVSDIVAVLSDGTKKADICDACAKIKTKGMLSAEFSVGRLVFSDKDIEASAEEIVGNYNSDKSSLIAASVKKMSAAYGTADLSLEKLDFSGSLSDTIQGTLNVDRIAFCSADMLAEGRNYVIRAVYDGTDAYAEINGSRIDFNSGDLSLYSSGLSGEVKYSSDSFAGIVLRELVIADSENGEYSCGDCNVSVNLNSEGNILFRMLLDMGLEIRGRYQDPDLQIELSTGILKFRDFESLIPFFGSAVFGSDGSVFSLTAGLSADISSNEGIVNLDFLSEKLNINGRMIDAKADASVSFTGSEASIDRFRIESSGYFADIKGNVDFDNELFNGNMVVRKEDSQSKYVDISASRDAAGNYSLHAVSDKLPDFSLDGTYLPTDEENIYILDAMWVYSTGSYPISWTIENGNEGFSAYSNGLFMDVSLGKEPSAYLTLRGFELPDFGGLVGGKLTGLLNFAVSADGGIEVNARKLAWDDNGYGFTVTGSFNSFSGVNITDFKLVNSEIKPIVGTASVVMDKPGVWDIDNLSGKVILNSETGEHVYLSMVPDSGKVDFLVDIERLNLRRLRYPELPIDMIDLNAYGSTDFKQMLSLSFDGNIGLNGKEYGTTGQYYDNKLELNDLRFNGLLTDTFLKADMLDGTLEFSTTVSVESRHVDRNAKISSDLVIKAGIDRKYQGLDIADIIRAVPEMVVEGTLSIEKFNADNRFLIDYLPISLKIDKFNRIELSGNEINAILELNDGISFTADIKGDKLPFAFNGKGYFKDGYTDVKADYIRVPFDALNIILLRPILDFGNCDIYGSGRMVGSIVNPEFFGNLGASDLSISVFWVPDQEVSVKNLYVTVYGDTASIASTPFWVINKKTGLITQGFVFGECSITQMNIPDWFLDITLPSNTVDVYVPIPGAKLTINTKAKGNIRLTGIGPVVVITGSATAEDALVSMPCVLPDWFLIPVVPADTNSKKFKGRTQDYVGIDLDINTGKGVKFLYPNAKSPALRVTASEGQNVHVNYDYSTKKAKIDGEATVSGGNIYYFQKDFFITEGSIRFDSNSTSINQLKDFSPVINLRATLKSYDKKGNPTEIYLILTDSYLNDYNPRFESSTGLTTEEIFSILGNSILPTDVYGAGSTISLASVATTTYEMLARLGVMKDFLNFMPFNDLSDTLKGALNLDMLSFRSLLLQNFIIDTLNMDKREKNSPIARYLNGTSMFLGKYFSNMFLLQGIIRLDMIDENNNIRKTDVPTFLANDLGIDMEVSFGWNSPIAEFSLFTQPTELSLFGFMDNIGLSIKKRLSF